MEYINKIIHGNAFKLIKELPNKSINMMITSSPYWLQRSYGTEPITLGETMVNGMPYCVHGAGEGFHQWVYCKGYSMKPDSRMTGRGFESSFLTCDCGAYRGEFGLEPTSDMFIAHYMELLTNVVGKLTDDGVMFIEIADKYGSGKYGKPTGKCFIPEKLACALDNTGLYCRNDIILHRVPSRPESLKTRFSRKYAHLYMFTKKPSSKHYFDLESSKVVGVEGYPINPGDVWTTKSGKMKGSNTASFSLDMLEIAIKAGCPKGGIVLDIFNGVGHTTYMANKLGRKYCGFELLEENYNKSLKIMEGK